MGRERRRCWAQDRLVSLGLVRTGGSSDGAPRGALPGTGVSGTGPGRGPLSGAGSGGEGSAMGRSVVEGQRRGGEAAPGQG